MSVEINPWRQWHGAFVPEWLMRSKTVSAGAKLCYARLCRYAGKEGVARPDQKELAEELAVDARTVRRYVAELEDMRLIRVEQVGLNQPNRYYFLNHSMMWEDDDTPGPERTDLSTPERTDAAGPDRTDVSTPSSSRESATRVTTPVARRATPTQVTRRPRKQRPAADTGDDLESLGSGHRPAAPTDLGAFRKKRALTPTYLGIRWDEMAEASKLPEQERGATGGLVRNIKKWVAEGATGEQVLAAMELFFLAPEAHHRGGKRAWLSFVDHWPALFAKVTAPDITNPDHYTEHREQKQWSSMEEYEAWALKQAKAGARV